MTLRSRCTSTASGRVIDRVMTKAMTAESASATAMTIQIVRWPRLALAAVPASAARFSASRSRANAERVASRRASAGVASSTYAVRDAVRPWSPLAWRTVSARESATAWSAART